MNDPAMTDATEVKAQVKLRYISSGGIDCVTARTMQVQKTKKGLTFKSLDGTMKTTNNQGERVSTTMKCSDLDRCVSESLGVTSAILENVIFCHQEDSNWPMQEGMILKKKLDDIFESTRYTKALEAFSKSKKEFAAKAKDLKAAQSELAAHMSAADLYIKEQRDCKENEEECREEMQLQTEQIERVEVKIERCRETLKRMESSKEEVTKMQWKIDDLKRRVEEKTQNLEKVHTESDRALAELLDDFDNEMQKKEQSRRELQRSIDALSYESSQLRDEADELNVKRGVADSLAQHFGSLSTKFNECVRKVCQKYNIQPPVIFDGTKYKPTAAREFLNRLNSAITTMQQESDLQMEILKQQAADQEKVVSDIRSNSQRQELEFENCNKEIHRMSGDISARQNGLSALTVSRDNLANLERDYESEKAQLDVMIQTNGAKTEEFKRKTREFTDALRHVTDDYHRDADVLSSLNMRRSEMLQNEAAERQVNSDEEQILADAGLFFRTHCDSLDHAVVPQGPDGLDPVLSSLERRTQDKRRELAAKKKESDELIGKNAASEALLADLKKKLTLERSTLHTLRTTEEDFREVAERVKSLLNDFEPAEETAAYIDNLSTLDGVKMAVEWLTSAVGRIEGMRAAAQAGKRQSKKLKSEALNVLQQSKKDVQDVCPCCAQAVKDDDTRITIERNLPMIYGSGIISREQENSVRENLKHQSEALKKLEEPIRQYAATKSSIQEIDGRINELEQISRQPGSSASKLKDDIQVLESFISASDKAQSTLQELKIRWKAVQTRKRECEDKKRNIQSSQFGADTGGRSIETIEQQQNDRMKQKETLQNDKDKTAKDEAEHLKRFYVINASVTEKEKSLDEARKKGDRYTQEKKLIDDLQKQLLATQQSKRDISSARDATTRELSAAQSDLTEKKNRSDDAQQLTRHKMDEIRSSRDSVQTLSESLTETQQKMSGADLTVIVSKIEEIQRRITSNQTQVQGMNPQINTMNADLLNQEHTKRVVRENIELRHCRKELEDSKTALVALKERKGLDDTKYNDLVRDLQRAEQEKSKLSSENSVLNGKLCIYDQQLRDVAQKLNGPNYKNIKQRHRRKAIEYETTEMAVRDLDSYYNAL